MLQSSLHVAARAVNGISRLQSNSARWKGLLIVFSQSRIYEDIILNGRFNKGFSGHCEFSQSPVDSSSH